MDQRDFLSHVTTRCILVFFENTIASFNRKPSPSRIRWFENFRDYLDVNTLGYANSKMSGEYTEEIIYVKMKNLKPSVKSWLIELALEMITCDLDFDLEDFRITAVRISKALDVPESNFYDVITFATAELEVKKKSQNGKVEAKRTIYYSKYKTTAIFYTSGDYVIEIFEDDTLTLTAPTGKKYDYEIINVFQKRNDFFFFLKNPRSGSLGYFKMMPLGKAEFKFDIGNIVKLKI
jgi:hypothetical protein